MALSARKFSSRPLVSDSTTITKSHRPVCLVSKSAHHCGIHPTGKRVDLKQQKDVQHLIANFCFSKRGLWRICQNPQNYIITRGTSVLCWSNGSNDRGHDVPSEVSSGSTNKKGGHQDRLRRSIRTSQGIAEACKFVYNDAKFVNERACNDMYLLSRGIMSLDARARRDIALLGLEFLKLDARAREDTEKIDRDVKEKAEHLHHITSILKNKAQSKLRSAADKHWSDGALEADLRRADIRAKQRAKEDAFMALEFVKNIHDRMVSKVYKLNSSLSSDGSMGRIMLEKNGKSLEFFSGEVSTDRISAIQEAYFCMAAALSEADGIDYTDPEELELLVTTLIDLDAMDGKSTVSLLVECSRSPDVSTRKALANALATAPSMWTLGNAGMGALQRLSEDSNPAIAAAASRAINELKEQWQIEEGDTWRFTRSLISMEEDESEEPEDT